MNSQGTEDTEAVDLDVEVDHVVDITEGAMAMVEGGEGITCIVPSSWHSILYSIFDESLGLLYCLPSSLRGWCCKLYMCSERIEFIVWQSVAVRLDNYIKAFSDCKWLVVLVLNLCLSSLGCC